MALVDDYKVSDIARIGEGSYKARIAQVFDLGMQDGKCGTKDKLGLTCEVPT